MKKYFIIGSVKQFDDIIDCANIIINDSDLDRDINYVGFPTPLTKSDDINKNELNRVIKNTIAIRYIKNSDVIVVIKKPDNTIGESTLYELSYAIEINKEILYYDPIDKTLGENRLSNKNKEDENK